MGNLGVAGISFRGFCVWGVLVLLCVSVSKIFVNLGDAEILKSKILTCKNRNIICNLYTL